MKYFIKYAVIWVVAIMTLPFHSCDYLNVNDYFNETIKYDSVFVNKRNFERYMWATAADFPDEADNVRMAFYCDEGFSMTNDWEGMQYVLGNITPTNPGSSAKWNRMYIIIRKANTLLANINKPVDMGTLDKRDALGYIYFMRAYAYYQLLMQYGPLVILGDDVLETNEEIMYYDRARETFDNSVDYVCAELEQAAAYMPSPELVPVSYFGRPSRDAALGMIARLRLIQASPQWNGGAAARRTYGTWKRSTDGVNYVSQTPDESKWAVAAMACKRIIDRDYYKLHTVVRTPDSYPLPANVSDLPFPNGAGDIDPFRSYSDMFTGEAVSMRNPEFLWGRASDNLTSFTRHSFPVMNLNGWNSISIPQKMIDAYLMADGHTINDASAQYPYGTGFLGGSDRTFSGYRLRNTVHNMYVNREMRFYASIGFSEAYWPCNSTTSSARKAQTLTYYADGNAGKASTNNYPNNYCITGYTLKKYVHEDDSWGTPSNAWAENSRRVDKSFPIIRYAEILLSYVEALNNLTGSHTVQDAEGKSYTLTRNLNEMAQYFNMVRYRAGLPGLTGEELASVQTMQNLIERERMVEFLFEGMRYYDVRRWGKYEQEENTPMMGMDTDASRMAYYSAVPINHSRARNRIVDRKLILYPIELNEIRKSPSMDQNPGWQK